MVEVVGIMTPSGDHYKIAKEFAKHKIHIICDKPLTATMEEADELCSVVKKSDAHFFLTHNYSGYPVVREMKRLVKEGERAAMAIALLPKSKQSSLHMPTMR